jgi:phosphatidylcholine synthase
LDDIADFLTYVIVPMFLAYHLKMVPSSYLWTLGFPVLASGYGFCQGQAKTTDGFFTGFPSYWNILVLYFYLLETPPLFNAWAFLVCSFLFLFPLNSSILHEHVMVKKYLLSLGLLWACCLGYMLYQMKETPPLFLYFSLLYPLYYTLYSLLLNRYTPTLPQEETPHPRFCLPEKRNRDDSTL